MIPLYSVLVIVVLALGLCAVLLAFQSRNIHGLQEDLSESLLKRRHKIPLLLEVIGLHTPSIPNKEQIIALRNTLADERSFDALIDGERNLSRYINEIFAYCEGIPAPKEEAVYHALRKEFDAIHLEITENIHTYDRALSDFNLLKRFPWFWIFHLAFTASKAKPILGV